MCAAIIKQSQCTQSPRGINTLGRLIGAQGSGVAKMYKEKARSASRTLVGRARALARGLELTGTFIPASARKVAIYVAT